LFQSSWLFGVLRLYGVGDLEHVLFPVGLMSFCLGLKARDAAASRGRDVTTNP